MSKAASPFLRLMGSDDNILLLDKQGDLTDCPHWLMITKHLSQSQKKTRRTGAKIAHVSVKESTHSASSNPDIARYVGKEKT